MTELTPEALAILAGGDAPAKKSGGRLQTVALVVALTLVALAGGSALGYVLGQTPAPAVPAPAAAPAEAGGDAASAETAVPASLSGETILPLEPVLTDIASPPGTQMRLEASLVLHPAEGADTALLATQVQADMIVFVRTLELAQVEGARGLLHLKEDLLERAKLRSPDVTDVVVRSLVVK